MAAVPTARAEARARVGTRGRAARRCSARSHSHGRSAPHRLARSRDDRDALRDGRRRSRRRGRQLRPLSARGRRAAASRRAARSRRRADHRDAARPRHPLRHADRAAARSSSARTIPYLRRTRTAASPDITETIRALGARVGIDGAARMRWPARIERSSTTIRARVANSRRPKTLLVFGREPGTLRNIDASGGYGFLHDMLETAGGTDVLGDIHQQSVMMTHRDGARARARRDHRAALRRRRYRHRDGGLAAWNRAGVGAGRQEPPRLSASTATSSSSPGRASPRPPNASRARCIRRRSNEDAGVVEQRQGQRVDGARACAQRGDVEIGALLTTINADAQRVAMHAVRVDAAAGAGRRARAAAVADADSVAVPQRRLRARDGGGGAARGRRRLHARSRSAICFSRTSAAIAKSGWPAPA